MEKLLESEPWIRAEERYFGQEGTLYDFRNIEPLQLTEEISILCGHPPSHTLHVNHSALMFFHPLIEVIE